MPKVDWSQQFIDQILRFERWQGAAEALEKAADEKADGDPFRASRLLADHFPYKQACANRTAAQKRAYLYGIAALLQHFRRLPEHGQHGQNYIPVIPSGGNDG